MVIRCKNCQGTIWIQTEANHAGAVTCKRCSQEYRFKTWDRIRSSERRLSEEARKLAREKSIDLPGAYSVLLGIMTAEEVRELGDHASTACRTTVETKPAEAPTKRVHYDPAFQPAVDQGLLTAAQATERGKRDTYAALLATKHRLPKGVAYDIADNRISLLQVLRRREAAPSAEVGVRLKARWPRVALWVTISCIPVALVAARIAGPGIEPITPPADVEQLGPVELRADNRGRVVQVIGPDPRSVLQTFCEAGLPGGPFEALEILPSQRPGARSRIGLLRNPTRPTNLLAIMIREDRDGERWVAGDGQSPLVAEPAPAGAESAIRE